MKKRIWEEEKWLHFFTAGHSPLDRVARGREKKREEERRNVCLGKGRAENEREDWHFFAARP